MKALVTERHPCQYCLWPGCLCFRLALLWSEVSMWAGHLLIVSASLSYLESMGCFLQVSQASS